MFIQRSLGCVSQCLHFFKSAAVGVVGAQRCLEDAPPHSRETTALSTPSESVSSSKGASEETGPATASAILVCAVGIQAPTAKSQKLEAARESCREARGSEKDVFLGKGSWIVVWYRTETHPIQIRPYMPYCAQLASTTTKDSCHCTIWKHTSDADIMHRKLHFPPGCGCLPNITSFPS